MRIVSRISINTIPKFLCFSFRITTKQQNQFCQNSLFCNFFVLFFFFLYGFLSVFYVTFQLRKFSKNELQNVLTTFKFIMYGVQYPSTRNLWHRLKKQKVQYCKTNTFYTRLRIKNHKTHILKNQYILYYLRSERKSMKMFHQSF